MNAKGKLAQFTLVGRVDKNIDSLSHCEINEIIKSPSIDWVGEVADVRPSIQGCHVFVLPSYREGLPRSALEAMSVGRAIITTDVPGCRSIVENNVNGKLIPARDASALETAMEFYIQKKKFIRMHGHNSRPLVEQRFANSIIVDAMLNSLELDS